MANFDISDLHLVRPTPLSDEAYQRAVHASPILDSARIHEDFESALIGADLVVGTSGRGAENEKNHLRRYLTPAELGERMDTFDGEIALVFGREDHGLSLDELSVCDLLVTIPTSPRYPTMNLSHAVAVLLYEVARHEQPDEVTMASPRERGLLRQRFRALLDALGYRPSRKRPAMRMFHGLVGRAMLSRWEYHRLMGVLGRSLQRVEAANYAAIPWTRFEDEE